MGRTPWIMLGWLLLAQLTVAFVGRSIGPLAPFIRESFELSKAEIGLLPAALFAGQALISLPAGWYADVIGTRKMLLILTSLVSIGFIVVSLVPSFAIVLVFVFIGGFGYGAMHPTSNRGIIHWFPRNQAGTAMGIKQMGVTGGSMLAAVLLIPLSVMIGWKPVVILASCVLFGVGFLSYFFYRDAPEGEGQKKPKPAFKSTVIQLLKHKPLVLVSIAAMGLTGAQLSLTTYLVLYTSDILRYPLVLAGGFLVLSELGGTLGRVVWGTVSDRWFHGNRSFVLILISIITALCSLAVGMLPPGFSLFLLILLIFIFGFCIAGFNGLWMNFAAESVPREIAGVASGFSLAIGSLGVVLGPPLFGWIIDLSGSYAWAWICLSLEMILVIGLLFWAERESRAHQDRLEYQVIKL
ncbi:MFS transporter [Ammoniphilus sp. YIM 78166]|uniref:MFS transporter n=1 Tax=Ammoniphilus sp. YIM 78166 TaxID=1644106 RepID=UPI00106F75D4|nr:MFS transporter [Ammoniphilus sp. YIM 78166]